MLISHVHSLKVGPDVEGIIRAASSDDHYIRLNAVSALGEVGDERASEALVAICLRDPYYPVRFEAAESLRKVNDKRAVDMLAGALHDEDPAIRLRAVEALGKLGDRRAVSALSAAMKDEDGAVRDEALASLGKIGDPRVMNMVVAAMKRKRARAPSRTPTSEPRRAGTPRAAPPPRVCSRTPGTSTSSWLPSIDFSGDAPPELDAFLLIVVAQRGHDMLKRQGLHGLQADGLEAVVDLLHAPPAHP